MDAPGARKRGRQAGGGKEREWAGKERGEAE